MAGTIWFSNWNFRFSHVNGKYPRSIVSIVSKFSSARQINLYWIVLKGLKAKFKIWKRKQTKTPYYNKLLLSIFFCNLRRKADKRPLLQQSASFNFSYEPTCLQKYFHGRVLSIRVFSSNGHYPMNTVASRDQFKAIRIRENLVVNYNWQ